MAAIPLLSLTKSKTGLVRPPGALSENQFTQTCIACQECIRICPSQALRPLCWKAVLTSIERRTLLHGRQPVHSTQVAHSYAPRFCPVGAIRSIPVSEMKTGVARVDHKACLAWDQVKCLVCVEACLLDAAKSVNGRIIVDAEKMQRLRSLRKVAAGGW